MNMENNMADDGMNDELAEATDKKPSIKLVQASRNLPSEKTGTMYVVKSMVDYFKFEIGERLTKEQVQFLVDDGNVKVTIS